MKFEEINKQCPLCKCQDKSISRKRTSDLNEDTFYIRHIPQGTVGVIRCSECGHIFEYCHDSKMPVKVKKIQI